MLVIKNYIVKEDKIHAQIQENKTKEKKDQANERDRKRRKIKEEVKLKKQSRKGKDTIYREYTTNEIAAMNPAKRRRLEDLGILSKSK